MNKTPKETAPIIQEMVRRIVKTVNPLQIILFGSHARGTAGPDSDVDLLVVMPVSGSKRKKEVELHRALAGVGLPKDVIVTTPEDSKGSQCSRNAYPSCFNGRQSPL